MNSQAHDPAKNSKSEMVKIMTSDGLFNMPAIITYPLNFDPSKKYPVVFTIYGGRIPKMSATAGRETILHGIHRMIL